MKRPLRIGGTLLLTGLALAYLVWKIDIHQTVDILVDASPWWFLLAVGIMIGTALPMALRWQWLMRAQRMHETLRVADAGVLRLLHGEPGAPHVDRGRRDARVRDGTPASRPHGAT